MSKKLVIATACALLAFGASAQVQEGPWLVRVRAVNLHSANKDTTGLGLAINNKTMPELDISYFFTPNIAAELVLTVPQKHTLSSNGAAIGTLKHLPPVLSAQYHFSPTSTIRPYVGAGLNYTNFSSVHFDPAVDAALHPNIKHSSVGLSLQIGADIALAKNLFLNLDVKKVQLGTPVYSSGTQVGTFKVDPVLASVGLGMRF